MMSSVPRPASQAFPSLAFTASSAAYLEGVEKSYGSVPALRGIDLELRRGEVLAVLGPNGAGKTTAVSLLLGLLRPDAGEVSLLGGDPRDAGIRSRIGVMLQDGGVAPTLTVRELVDLFRSYYPEPSGAAELVETAGLHGLLDRRSTELSGGQHRRLMFALALAGNPELLFLDEPSAGLDPDSRRRLWGAVRSLADRGRTVLLTTHHLEEAAALADRVAVIHRGVVIAEGTPAELEARVSGRLVRCVTSVEPSVILHLEHVHRVERRGVATEILTSRPEPVLRRLLVMDPDLHDLEVTGAGLEQAFFALTAHEETTPDLDSREGTP